MISTKAYYWADVSGEYPKSFMMFMYADRQKQTHNWLVHTMNVGKNANKLKMPFFIIFWKKQFLIPENEDIACPRWG